LAIVLIFDTDRRWGKAGRSSVSAAWLVVLAVMLVTSGCGMLQSSDERVPDTSLDPQEFTDTRSAVTVTGAAEPLVVSHEEPSLAVNARDYLSLGVIEVNRMGDYEHYLVVVAWSTIDRGRIRGMSSRPEVSDRLELRTDGHAFKLVAGSEPDPVRDRELYPTPAAASARRYFRVDAATLRSVVGAKTIQIRVDRGEDGTAVYYPWGTRGVEALRRFAARVED
jgi:hypothetical protein